MIKINNGKRPPKTSNKPVRSDRNISKNKNDKNVKNSNIISSKPLINNHPIKNKPPTPRIPHPSSKPLIKLKLYTNLMENNEDKKSNKWSDYTDDESLPEIPKEWKI